MTSDEKDTMYEVLRLGRYYLTEYAQNQCSTCTDAMCPEHFDVLHKMLRAWSIVDNIPTELDTP